MAASKKSGYENRARSLKKLGLINYDLRKKLTPSQKSNITKKYNEYQQYFTHPENFVVRHVSKAVSKIFKESGYKTIAGKIKNKIVFEVPENSSVKIKNKRAYIQTPTREYELRPSKRNQIFSDIEKMAHEKRKPGEFLTGKIGTNRHFYRKFDSPEKLLEYARAKTVGGIYNGKSIKKWNKEDAIQHMTIVKIKKSGRPQNAAQKTSKKKTRNN